MARGGGFFIVIAAAFALPVLSDRPVSLQTLQHDQAGAPEAAAAPAAAGDSGTDTDAELKKLAEEVTKSEKEAAKAKEELQAAQRAEEDAKQKRVEAETKLHTLDARVNNEKTELEKLRKEQARVGEKASDYVKMLEKGGDKESAGGDKAAAPAQAPATG
eukprot:TRINITY_DN12_c0_g1_i1.p1 TRINITY_DN12_c0_g1~~TRINITY_DN12_c0_g1_i1.p1  ORF type:complete len:160 (+),score=59.49 TRINITY_DN12_c0_g1_i1:145-624(+)